MPIVHVEMFEGRSLDQKRRLVRELTDAVCRVLGSDPRSVRVLIEEYRTEDWAIGGVLRADQEQPPEP